MRIKRRLFMEPSENKWESHAVLNPSVIIEKDIEHIFYRAVAKNMVSSIGYARVENGKIERFDKPIIEPKLKYEKKGIEDPRVTKVGNKYYMLYTAFDGKNARIAYAVSRNLKDWEKMGTISPCVPVNEARKLVKIKKYKDKWKNQEIFGSKVCIWDKDAILFPEKIDGKFVMLHRFIPDIQILKFRSFKELKNANFWRDYIRNLSETEDKVSLYRRYDWEDIHIGGGAVPIKTKDGWLLIYHGVELTKKNVLQKTFSNWVYQIEGKAQKLRNRRIPLVYHAGAALLDLKKPETEITRLKNPLFSPKYKWEKQGDINNVVFPEGAVVDKNKKLKIYYGCSDSRIGLAEMNLNELLQKLKSEKI